MNSGPHLYNLYNLTWVNSASSSFNIKLRLTFTASQSSVHLSGVPVVLDGLMPDTSLWDTAGTSGLSYIFTRIPSLSIIGLETRTNLIGIVVPDGQTLTPSSQFTVTATIQ
jgi:hypothetical protein